MEQYRNLLKDIWVDAQIVMDYEEAQPDWVYNNIRDIEKLIDLEELALHKGRFVKRGSDHLYKGAQVRTKRDIYYGEMFNDPAGQSPQATPFLDKGRSGTITDIWLDDEESDHGYFDCVVYFANVGTLLCRVEWLEWLEDLEDDEAED